MLSNIPNWPQSTVSDIAIISSVLDLARTLGQKQHVFCARESRVKIAVSCSDLHDLTNCVIQIPEVRVQLLGWWVTLHSYV